MFFFLLSWQIHPQNVLVLFLLILFIICLFQLKTYVFNWNKHIVPVENIRFKISEAEPKPKIVLDLFLNFHKFDPQCSCKVSSYKEKNRVPFKRFVEYKAREVFEIFCYSSFTKL